MGGGGGGVTTGDGGGATPGGSVPPGAVSPWGGAGASVFGRMTKYQLRTAIPTTTPTTATPPPHVGVAAAFCAQCHCFFQHRCVIHGQERKTMGRKKPVSNRNRAPATPSRRKGGRSNATTPKRRRKGRDGRLASVFGSVARAAVTKITNNPRFTQGKSFLKQIQIVADKATTCSGQGRHTKRGRVSSQSLHAEYRLIFPGSAKVTKNLESIEAGLAGYISGAEEVHKNETQ